MGHPKNAALLYNFPLASFGQKTNQEINLTMLHNYHLLLNSHKRTEKRLKLCIHWREMDKMDKIEPNRQNWTKWTLEKIEILELFLESRYDCSRLKIKVSNRLFKACK